MRAKQSALLKALIKLSINKFLRGYKPNRVKKSVFYAEF